MPQNDPSANAVSVALWYVYIVHCSDLTYYTGITTNLARRLAEHNSTHKGAKYTKPRRPVNLVYSEPALSRALAARREYQIKHMTVADKKKLIGHHLNLRLANTASHMTDPQNP